MSESKVDVLALKRIKVLDQNNEPVLFSTLWEKKPIVVIFIRHFGCVACKAHVSQVWAKKKDFEKKNIRVIFIGNGQPYLIKAFKDEVNAKDAEIYTDPSLESFSACGLQKGIRYLVNLKSLKKARDLQRQGFKNEILNLDTGSHTQMGGVVALKRPGEVLYHFIADYLGDFDDPDDYPSNLKL